MDNFQVKVSQVKELSGLASVQCLGLIEICQVLVVGEHLYQEGRCYACGASPSFKVYTLE